MEKLYIEVQNGQPINHPILESNLRMFFGDQLLPEQYIEFIKTPMPEIGVYEIYVGASYQIENDHCVEIHHVRNMNDEEKLNKQNHVKTLFTNHIGFSSWTFDENLCRFLPPVPMPEDGNRYEWNEETLSWNLITIES